MSSDIKNEFEEYVKTLTETICNDIFLEKLEQICHEYEDGVKPFINTQHLLMCADVCHGEIFISCKTFFEFFRH